MFLKQLKSGLLLVSGPFKLNGCPLRRINQNYVIATSTKLDISKVQVADNLNDQFFNRIKAKKSKPSEGEIFEKKEEVRKPAKNHKTKNPKNPKITLKNDYFFFNLMQKYKVTDERKKAQVDIDKQLLAAIKSHPHKSALASYLKSKFGLSNKQYPHQLKF